MIVISVGVLAFGGAVVNAIANAIANASATVIGPAGFYKKKNDLENLFFDKGCMWQSTASIMCMLHVESARSRQCNNLHMQCNLHM